MGCVHGANSKFLASFRLPGEAQKIERIMERFASEETSSWGLHNALTGYLSHDERVSVRRMEGIMAQARVEV